MKAEHFEELLRKIGEFGRYQKFVVALLSFATIPCAFHNMGMMFLGAVPNHHCRINNSTFGEGINGTIPWDDIAKNARSQCLMFADSSIVNGENETTALTYHIELNQTTKACEAWQYDDSIFRTTIVSEWDLVCDRKWLVALAQSIYMFGFFMGCVVFGDLSDRFGRKRVFLICTLIQLLFGVAAAFSHDFALLVFLRFVVGMATGGQRNSAFTLAQELCTPEWRAFVGTLVESFWAVGYIVLGGISYFLRDWRHVQLAISVPMTLYLTYFWLVPNSPRWLLAKGRVKEAEEILKQAARINGKTLPKDFHISPDHIVADKEQRNGKLTDLVRTPNIRKTTLIVWLNWFVVSMIFFGLSYSAGTLGGDIFLNNTFLGGVEILTMVLMPFVFRMGRRWPFCLSGALGGLFCIFMMACPQDLSAVLITLSTIGKSMSTAQFLVAYVYSSEVYPTVIRNLGLGVGSMFARAGAMVAPFVALMGGGYPYLVFGLSGVLAGFFSLMLPETYGRPLCDTVEMSEDANKLLGMRDMFKCVWKADPVNETVEEVELTRKVALNGNDEKI